MAARLTGERAGGLKLERTSDMNVTPFVGVMLVLLIIFMAVAPVGTVSIGMDNPTGVYFPTGLPMKPPTFISIQDNGRVGVSFGTRVQTSSMDRLGADLSDSLAAPNPTHERIWIRADKHVKYRQFMDVINQLRTDGYYNVGLISESLGTG